MRHLVDTVSHLGRLERVAHADGNHLEGEQAVLGGLGGQRRAHDHHRGLVDTDQRVGVHYLSGNTPRLTVQLKHGLGVGGGLSGLDLDTGRSSRFIGNGVGDQVVRALGDIVEPE